MPADVAEEAMTMKVLLRDDVAGVGRRGDIVKVAGGFARNFLLPEGRAIVATDAWRARRARCARPRPPRGQGPRGGRGPGDACWPGRSSPSRPGPAAAAGSSARSARPRWSRRSQATKGIEVDRTHVLLPEHIKETGSFDVTVELFDDVARW